MVLVPERRKGRFGARQEGGFRTLLSEREADLLRMAYWCQYLSPDNAHGLSSEEEIAELVRLGFLRIHRSSGAYVLTKNGVQLVAYMLDGKLPEISQTYHAAAIERRLRRSRLAMTAYRAGLNLFISSASELRDERTLFFTAYGRSRGHNPWGSTRIAAVAHLGGVVYAVHYLYPEIGPVHRGYLFAGESYQAVLEELGRKHSTGKQTKKVPYREAYRTLREPIHLLSCDEVGAMQLKIMSIPHYRLKLTKAALAGHYRSPPEDIPEWDALYDGSPLITAADMNLRRVEAGIQKARELGCAHIALLSLQEQGKLLRTLYGEDPFVSIYTLAESALRHFAGGPMELHRPKPTQYLTEKGGVIDTPLIQSYRKAER